MAKDLSVTINGKEYVSQEAKKAEDSLTSLKTNSQKALETLEAGAKLAASAFAGIATAVTAVAAATVKAAADTAYIDDMSQKLGMSREAFQEWSFILGQSGMSIDQLQTSMKTLANAATDAAGGNKTFSETFDKLGISVTDASGAIKSQEVLFNEAVVALSAMSSETERTALASDLFGRSATELAPLLNSGATAVEAMRTQAHDLGLVLSNEVIDSGAKLDDTIDALKRTFSALTIETLAPLMPVLDGVANSFMGMLKGDAGSFDQFADSVSGFVDTALGTIIDMAPQLVEMGGKILTSLIDGIAGNTDQIAGAVTSIVVALVEFVTQNLPTVVAAAFQIIIALGKGLVEAVPNIAYSVWEMVTALIDTLMGYVGNFAAVGQNFIAGLIQGIKDWVQNAVDAVVNAGKSIVDGFKNFFGIHSPSTVFAEFGKFFMQGLAKGIEDNNGLVSEALKASGLTPEMDGEINVNVSTTAGGQLAGLLTSLSSIQAILDPIRTILAAAMDVLGPVINDVLSPFVGILKVIGQLIGGMLTPVIQLLTPVIKLVADVFMWLYNKVLLPAGNGLITVFNLVYNGIVGVMNGIAIAVNFLLGWLGVHMNTYEYRSLNAGHMAEIDYGTLVEQGGGANGASYAGGGAGSSTSVQSLNITVHQHFEGNVIGDGGLEAVGQFMVRALQSYAGVGGNVKVIVGGAA